MNSVHRVLAVVLFLPLIWLAVTGALLGFAGETDRVFHPELLSSPHEGSAELPWVQQAEKLGAQGDQWLAFFPAQTPFDPSYWVDANGVAHYVNPETGAVRGQRLLSQSWPYVLMRWHKGEWPVVAPLFHWVAIVASLGLFFLIATGLMLLIKTRKRIALPTHNLIGAISAPPLIILLVAVGFLLWRAPLSTPADAIEMSFSHPAGTNVGALVFSAADLRGWQAFARSRLKNCTPLMIDRPSLLPQGLRLTCVDGRSWSSSSVSPLTGVLSRPSLADQALDWHTGAILGQAGRVIWVLAALMVPFLWWSRRKRA